MSSFGGFGVPGQGAAVFTTEREIIEQGFDRERAVYKSPVIDGAARDAGNTPTTVLRPGLLLGRVTSTGKYKEWDASKSDGTENLAGVLWKETRSIDFDGNNADRSLAILVGGGVPLITSQLLILGESLVGDDLEFQARRQLLAMGFRLNDDPVGYLAGQGNRLAAKTANYTVLESDNGTLFTNKGAAGAVTFTLPAEAKRGLEYEFFVVADQTVTVAAGTADTMVVFNDAAADSIAFSTSSKKIGGRIKVVGDGALWYVFVNLGAETQTPTIVTA